jgi:hypothetical protein
MASKVDVEGEESYHCRALLLCATTDTRARAVVQNFQEFNSLLKRDKCDDNDGEIGGCPYCISTAWRDVSSFFFYPSDQLMSSQPEVRKVIYPFQRDPPRREYEEVMNDFHENGSKKTLAKGVSVLSRIPHMDVIHHFAIDAMHCVCEEIVKMLLKFWFSHRPFRERNSHLLHSSHESTKHSHKHDSCTISHDSQGLKV